MGKWQGRGTNQKIIHKFKLTSQFIKKDFIYLYCNNKNKQSMKTKTILIDHKPSVIEYKSTGIGDKVYNLKTSRTYIADIMDADDVNWIVTGEGKWSDIKVKVYIPNDDIQGDKEAKTLYLVTFVDQDDTEDTHSELWRAHDGDNLYDQILEDRAEGADDRELFEEEFEEKWGIEVLKKIIGTIE